MRIQCTGDKVHVRENVCSLSQPYSFVRSIENTDELSSNQSIELIFFMHPYFPADQQLFHFLLFSQDCHCKSTFRFWFLLTLKIDRLLMLWSIAFSHVFHQESLFVHGIRRVVLVRYFLILSIHFASIVSWQQEWFDSSIDFGISFSLVFWWLIFVEVRFLFIWFEASICGFYSRTTNTIRCAFEGVTGSDKSKIFFVSHASFWFNDLILFDMIDWLMSEWTIDLILQFSRTSSPNRLVVHIFFYSLKSSPSPSVNTVCPLQKGRSCRTRMNPWDVSSRNLLDGKWLTWIGRRISLTERWCWRTWSSFSLSQS